MDMTRIMKPGRSKKLIFLRIASLLLPATVFLLQSPTVTSFAPSIHRVIFSVRTNLAVFDAAVRKATDDIDVAYGGDDASDGFDDESLGRVQLPQGLEDALTESDLSGLSVTQLKQQLRLRGLKVGGRKSELIDRLLGIPINTYSSLEEEDNDVEESIARKFAKERGKELVDVSEYLDEKDQEKTVKTWGDKAFLDAEFEIDDKGGASEAEKSYKEDARMVGNYEAENSYKEEVWGSDARIVDYEGRRIVVDSLSRLMVEFKGSNQSYVSALVIASRDALKPYLAGGVNTKNQTQAEQSLREIQMKREQANRMPLRFEDDEGLDEGDETGLYANVLSRDYSDWGKYTVTGAQLSAQEVQGVLLLSDVYGAFTPDTQALAEKIAFECQPVVVFIPDLFRGDPWKENTWTPEKNEQGQSYEEWRATHSDLRVSVDIRAAASCLRERYGVSSVVVWGVCYGGGRALEAASGYLPNGNVHDVDGSLGPRSVNPMAAVAWYPTRYNATALFGNDRVVGNQGQDNAAPEVAVIAIFAGKDVRQGATPDDASKLKALLSEDPGVKDSLVKVFPDQDHGFAHIGLARKVNADTEPFQRFVDDEFGGAGKISLDDGEADVACLLSTAFMETYSRVFLPTTGIPIAKEAKEWSAELEMKSLSDANTRDIRREIEESLNGFVDQRLDGYRVDPTDEAQRQEMETLLWSLQDGTDRGPYTIEPGDELELMYAKLKAQNEDFELF